VEARRGYTLVVTWRGGAESLVDVAGQITEFSVLRPLRSDQELFRQVRVGDWGWCVHWSDDMEISSDTLWRLALEQGSAWLRDWRLAHRMTQAQAAKALGVSPRMWRYYEAGIHLLPKTVKLAGVGFDAHTSSLFAATVTNVAGAGQSLHPEIIFGQSSDLARRLPTEKNVARTRPLVNDIAVVLHPTTIGRSHFFTPDPAAINQSLIAAMGEVGEDRARQRRI